MQGSLEGYWLKRIQKGGAAESTGQNASMLAVADQKDKVVLPACWGQKEAGNWGWLHVNGVNINPPEKAVERGAIRLLNLVMMESGIKVIWA